MSRLYFRKSQRIVSEQAFSRVLSCKCFVCKGMLRLYRASNEADFSRFGISIGKSVGNAVLRNRYKRLGREVFRLHQHEFETGFDYVLILTQKRPKIKQKDRNLAKAVVRPTYQSLEADLMKMVQLLNNKGR